MHGLMMDMPLSIAALIQHADRHHGDTEIVSRTVEGHLHRYGYSDAHRRARQLANALRALGVKPHDRVGTLAWNGYRHFEIYYAASGSGAVVHTINPRLFPEQITYIVNHADDAVLFFDLTFLPLVEKLAPLCRGVRAWIAMTDRAHMPGGGLDLLCYEELVDSHSDDYRWPEIDERSAAGLCYTSGTT
ncbi:MAG: AMP-binding protein, partial [Betaproteobacteria bacterium]